MIVVRSFHILDDTTKAVHFAELCAQRYWLSVPPLAGHCSPRELCGYDSVRQGVPACTGFVSRAGISRLAHLSSSYFTTITRWESERKRVCATFNCHYLNEP